MSARPNSRPEKCILTKGELVVESQNDYEYLIFSDTKAAGFEALDSLRGYVKAVGGISVYRE